MIHLNIKSFIWIAKSGLFLTHWVIQGLNHHPFGMKLISLFEKWYELILLIYCKAFLHLGPYHSCASVCLHLSSGLAFIPKEEPDPLGSMHIYINTAYIGSLWRPKKENHLKMGQDAMSISQNTTQYRCLCFLVNYFTKKASAALSERLFQVPLKSCHLLHSSSETPGCCQEAISNQKMNNSFLILRW